jgi:hypothetical protein
MPEERHAKKARGANGEVRILPKPSISVLEIGGKSSMNPHPPGLEALPANPWTKIKACQVTLSQFQQYQNLYRRSAS